MMVRQAHHEEGQPDLFSYYGTDPHKLHRRDGLETSEEAAYSVDTTKLEREVHLVITSFGANGCISDDVRMALPGLPYSSVTARYSALEEKGYICRGPDKRKGNARRSQFVMRDTHFKPAETL
jgi:hypothetical protein